MERGRKRDRARVRERRSGEWWQEEKDVGVAEGEGVSGWRDDGGQRMVARGSCAAAAVAAAGWEPGERNRRDDNICIIFNARTSGLRGGRQPPPAGGLLLPRLLRSSLPLSSWSPFFAPRPLSQPHSSVATATAIPEHHLSAPFPSPTRPRPRQPE